MQRSHCRVPSRLISLVELLVVLSGEEAVRGEQRADTDDRADDGEVRLVCEEALLVLDVPDEQGSNGGGAEQDVDGDDWVLQGLEHVGAAGEDLAETAGGAAAALVLEVAQTLGALLAAALLLWGWGCWLLGGWNGLWGGHGVWFFDYGFWDVDVSTGGPVLLGKRRVVGSVFTRG